MFLPIRRVEHGSWVVKGTLGGESETYKDVEGIVTFNWSSVPANSRTIVLELNIPLAPLTELPFAAWSFAGITEDGLPVKVSELYCTAQSWPEVFTDRDECIASFVGSKLIIWHDQTVELLRFYFPDLVFGFSDIERMPTGLIGNHTAFDGVGDEYEGIRIDFRAVPGLTQEAKKDNRVAAKHLTTVATVSSGNVEYIDYGQVEPLISALGQSIGLAVGFTRTWVFCEGIRDDESVFVYYRDVSYAVSSRFPIVSAQDASSVQNLSSCALSFYLGCDSEAAERFRRLVLGLQLYSSQLVFPAPFLFLGAKLEEFIEGELDFGRRHMLEKPQREEALKKFEVWMKSNVFHYMADTDDAQMLCDNLKREFNVMFQRDLSYRIRALLDSVILPYDEQWVNDFVSRRNRAAHGGHKPMFSNHVHTYLRIVSLIHRYLLMRIGYTGEMIDWAISPPKDARISSDGSVSAV